jgi:hypothetical protein
MPPISASLERLGMERITCVLGEVAVVARRADDRRCS